MGYRRYSTQDPSLQTYKLTGLTHGKLRVRVIPNKELRSDRESSWYLDKSFPPKNLASEINLRVAERVKQKLVDGSIEFGYSRMYGVEQFGYWRTCFEDTEGISIDFDPKEHEHWMPIKKLGGEPLVGLRRTLQLCNPFDDPEHPYVSQRCYYAELSFGERGRRISYNNVVPLVRRVDIDKKGIISLTSHQDPIFTSTSDEPKRAERKRAEDDLYRIVLSFMEISE